MVTSIELLPLESDIARILSVEIVNDRIFILATTSEQVTVFLEANFDLDLIKTPQLVLNVVAKFEDWSPINFDLNISKGLVAFTNGNSVSICDLDLEID